MGWVPERLTLRPMRVLARNDKVIDKDLGVSLLHCGDNGFQDIRVDLVIPVLDDRMQIICTGAFDGLLSHEIVSHAVGAWTELRELDDLGAILQKQRARKLSLKSFAQTFNVMTGAAANID